MTALKPAPRARFVRESAPHDVKCLCLRPVSQRQRIVGAALLRCKDCGQWLYAVGPRTGEVDFLVERVLTYAVTEPEMVRIEIARLNPFEALIYLGVIDLASVTVVSKAKSA